METQKPSGSKMSPVIIFLILLLAIGGYFFFQQKKGPAVSPEMKAAQEAVLKDCVFDKEFCMYAANAVVAMGSGYSVTSESEYEGKKTVTKIQMDGKNNTQSTSMIDGKEEGTYLVFDNTTYVKNADSDSWIAYPPMKEEGKADKQGFFDVESFKSEMAQFAKDKENDLQVKKQGTEKCGNLTCVIFEMTDKTTSTTTRLWIDTKEYLARKMVTPSSEGSITMTFDYSPVIITKPVNVTPMPSFDTMMQESGVNINMDDLQNMMKDLPTEE